MRRSKRRQRKSNKRRYQRGSGVENHTEGKFYLLGSGSGFRPLYLTMQELSSEEMIALSCPPVNPPEPHYYIRGSQYDTMLKSALTAEIEITSYEHYTDGDGEGIRLTGKLVDDPTKMTYTIDISKDWIYGNSIEWINTFKQNNKVLKAI